MIQYRQGVDLIEMLREAGYTTYRIRKEKILGESVLTKFRRGELPSWAELAKVCQILHCQPGDLVEYVETPGE